MSTYYAILGHTLLYLCEIVDFPQGIVATVLEWTSTAHH